MTQTALVVGASGIVGSAITQLLIDNQWQVAALSRHPSQAQGVIPVAADLQDPASLDRALAGLKPTHVFITTWSRQATEAQNIRVNAAMVRNVLAAIRPAKSVKHVALVTGLKHYLGPFEAYGKGSLPQTPFREEQGRLDVENFYYAQEDELFAAAEKDDRQTLAVCELGLIALQNIKDRYLAKNRIGATGDELQAPYALVDVSEDFWKRQPGSLFIDAEAALSKARAEYKSSQERRAA